jgi:hypothetical protein
VVESVEGPYGEEGTIVQEFYPLPKFGDSYTLIGNRRRSATLFDENVRIETRQILGNQRPVFTNADPGRHYRAGILPAAEVW